MTEEKLLKANQLSKEIKDIQEEYLLWLEAKSVEDVVIEINRNKYKGSYRDKKRVLELSFDSIRDTQLIYLEILLEDKKKQFNAL